VREESEKRMMDGKDDEKAIHLILGAPFFSSVVH